MIEKILQNYYNSEFDDRIKEYEDNIDVYPSGTVGVQALSITGNLELISGSATTSIIARNTALNCLAINLNRNSTTNPLNINQYTNGQTTNVGINMLRGGNTSDSHTDVLQDMALGGINARPSVSGSAFLTQTTSIARFYATEQQTSTTRGSAFEIIVTPSGSATGRRRVFNVDSNGECTLGTVARVPIFDLYARNINVTGNINPMVDNVSDLGTTSLRFNDAYVANGVITISDPNFKNSLTELKFNVKDFVNTINVYEGKFNFSSSNRKHFFLNSHEIRDYFKSKNMDYAVYTIENDIVSLRYHEMIPILLENIKILNKEIEELKQNIIKKTYRKVVDKIKKLF